MTPAWMVDAVASKRSDGTSGAPATASAPHDSTPHGSWLRERYEAHRAATAGHSTEDAFAFPVATRDQLLRRLDAMLGREGVLEGLTAPVSDYVPTMAREFYDDGA